MKRIRKKFQDWMTVISYAEVGEAELGLQVAGFQVPWSRRMKKETTPAETADRPGPESETDLTPAAAPVVPAVEPAPQKQKLEVMVVDDEPIVGKRLKPALSKCGYDVEVFDDPVSAMKRFDEKGFDIVVTDLRMDDIDGINVLERVTSRSDKTKVIFITGYATVENAREALVKGAFDFIAKPFNINDLRMAITKAALSLGYMGAVAGASA